MAEDLFTLTERVALVTGASSGIGAEIARAMGRAGASVALAGRDEDRLSAVTEHVKATGADAHAVRVDITEPDAPQRVLDETLGRFGRLDVLVNAAGIFLPKPLAETTDEMLDSQWNVNVRAPYRLVRAAAEHLPPGGAVIFVSSIAGHVGFPSSSAYCATKGAVELLVKALSMELASKGVRVNAVAPGNVRTSMNAHLLADEDYEQSMLAATPAGRIGEVGDIAPAVVFLASPAADYVHGASIVIDGGWAAA
jgi:NAD(P)-dependent dehydrogenase (short-subunit alcohol dehydrogenase family)